MPIIELTDICKRYRTSDKLAVDHVSFSLKKGNILALVGESGSGKTTLLRLIAGLEHPDKGIIRLAGQEIVNGRKSLAANRRKTGMVFQDYALFPHLSILENVRFGLNGMSKSAADERVYETLELTGLKEDVKKYPHQLSGGQQQRVALARALAPRPELLLMDEPFSNLDTILRDQVREEVQQIIKSVGITAILVTHDTKDAFSTADQIAVMLKGKLLQIDTPDALYNNPNSSYVAELFGKSNTLEAIAEPGGFNTPFGFVPTPQNGSYKDKVNLFFRAEETIFCEAEEPHLCGRVEKCIYLGDHMQLKICCNRCNSCANDNANKENSNAHSLLLKSSVQSWRPGDIVRFNLKNFKVRSPDKADSI